MKKRLSLLLIVGFLSSCSPDEDVGPKLTTYQLSVIEYFNEVALGFEFGGASQITRKWTQPMKIFVGGTPEVDHLTELNDIIDEINSLATDGFVIEVVNDTTESNYYVFFGTGQKYGEIFPNSAGFVDDNWGLFSLFWDGAQDLITGHMYVDIFRPDTDGQMHLLREEFTQSIGLARDSEKYFASIFQSSWTTTSEYAEIDRDLIRLLYHPDMVSGLSQSAVESVITQIFLNE